MRTTISISDDLFAEAEIAAKEAGLSRNEFFAQAIREYVERIRDASITDRLNALYR